MCKVYLHYELNYINIAIIIVILHKFLNAVLRVQKHEN